MIDVAIEAAKAAGQLALGYFKNLPRVTYKADKSPVTTADIEAEKLIRKIITKNFPDHGIIGEELKNINQKAKYQWVIDPIDGTRDFIRQNPFWCTLVAVLEEKKPIIGVCYYPHRNELFSAQIGKGAYFNGKKTYVSKVENLNQAYVNISSAHHFSSIKKTGQLLTLSNSVGASRYLSSYGYAFLWTGHADAVVVARGSIWDWAAPSVITEEAGGKFSDFNGGNSLDSGTAIFSNGLLHDQVLKILNSK